MALQAEDDTELPSFAAKADSYLQAASKTWNFSGTVLISVKSDIKYVGGVGKANYQLDVPNTSRTIFKLGSLVEQFIAAAVLQQAQKGLINVNQPFGKYLTNFPKALGNSVTVQDLLSQSSGLAETPNPAELYREKATIFEPGERGQRTNTNYMLLSSIISQVSGVPIEGYLSDRIFKPLGMKNTGFASSEKVISGMASGYSVDQNNQLINASCLDNSTSIIANGQLYSNVEDLFVWTQTLLKKQFFDDFVLQMMFKAYKGDYGFGWRVDEPKSSSAKLTLKNYEKLHVWLDGSSDGYLSMISLFPDDDVIIIVLSNNDFAFKNNLMLYRILDDLAALTFNKPYAQPSPSILLHF